MIWFFVFLFVYFFCIGRQFIKCTRISSEHIIPFTGGVGSGKTLMAVTALKMRYSILMLRYKLRYIPILRKWSVSVPPTIWSTIPIRIRVKGKWQYAMTASSEYWLMQKKFPENALVLADEFGQIASQYDYDNPNVQVNVQTLVRFFRHFTNGYLYITDQSAANIAVQVRRRFNVVYNVSNFRRYRIFGLIPTPYFKIDVSKLSVTEDNVQNANVIHNESNDESRDFFFIRLGLFTRKKKLNYETRCYRYAYNYGFVNARSEQFSNLYTRYLPDLSCEPSERKNFRYFVSSIYSGVSDPISEPPRAAPKGFKRLFRRADSSAADINEN